MPWTWRAAGEPGSPPPPSELPPPELARSLRVRIFEEAFFFLSVANSTALAVGFGIRPDRLTADNATVVVVVLVVVGFFGIRRLLPNAIPSPVNGTVVVVVPVFFFCLRRRGDLARPSCRTMVGLRLRVWEMFPVVPCARIISSSVVLWHMLCGAYIHFGMRSHKNT
jgi:hypothetical protein